MSHSEYKFPILTVDGVIFQLLEGKLRVLLIRRGYEPFKGAWALPGGYNPAGETTLQALSRVLAAKTGMQPHKLGFIEQLYTFDSVDRDPRGPSVSVTYMGLGKTIDLTMLDTVQDPRFIALDELPPLVYDHDKIIAFAHTRLKMLISSTNAAVHLLPVTFTLSEIQSAYEVILDKPLDKRNFRKKLLSLEILKDTGKLTKEGAHRPARLYSFRSTTLHHLAQNLI